MSSLTTILVVLKTFYYQSGSMSSEKRKYMEIFLGKKLKELREEMGLTQKQLAERLGMNSVTYLHYEKGQREPPLGVLADMSKFFGVTVDYLLGLTDYY